MTKYLSAVAIVFSLAATATGAQAGVSSAAIESYYSGCLDNSMNTDSICVRRLVQKFGYETVMDYLNASDDDELEQGAGEEDYEEDNEEDYEEEE